MCIFIKNDAHLYEIMEDKDQRFALNFENNNWFEIFFNQKNNAPQIPCGAPFCLYEHKDGN